MNLDDFNNRITRFKKDFAHFREKTAQYKYVSLFGVGKMAESWGYRFVKEWSQGHIVCFSDNNSVLWGKTIIDGLKCVPPAHLAEYGSNMLAVMLVKPELQEEIAGQLAAQGTEAIGISLEWLYIDEMIEQYLQIRLPPVWSGTFDMGHYNFSFEKDERVAVYTCILDGYDELRQPLVCDPQCDYYCLSMDKPDNPGIWQWIDVTGAFPLDITGDFTRINRYCKLHPHIFFPQYHYSIYIDGRIQIRKEISGLLTKIGKIGIAAYGIDSATMDTYEHASAMCFLRFKGESEKVIREQMQRYTNEGFPRYFGHTENGVMVREHHNESCIRVMDTWWNEVRNYSRRDQLSFMYAVWKNGFTPQDIGYIDDTFRKGPEFSVLEHNKDIRTKVFNRG